MALLLQKHRRSAHKGDASPVPDHDDEDAGCEESLHSKPNFCEAAILVDALWGKRTTSMSMPTISVVYLSRVPTFLEYHRSQSTLTTRRISLISPIPTLIFLRSLTGKRMFRR